MKLYSKFKQIFYMCLVVAASVPATNATAPAVEDGAEILRRHRAIVTDLIKADEALLKSLAAEFEAAPDPQSKLAIVCRHIGEDFGKFATNNTLALAIGAGNRWLVEKFLSVVEDVNSEDLYVWGYRQKYNLAHVALDPLSMFRSDVADLGSHLAIIDMLARKGADFNWIPKGGYENPPLSAGEPRGSSSKYINDLRARALLYGADPCLGGSSFYGLEKYEHVYELALDQLYGLGAGTVTKPVAHTKAMMRAIAAKREQAHKALLA